MRNVNLNGRYHCQDQVKTEDNPFFVENKVNNKCLTETNKEFFGGFLNLTAQRWKWRVLQVFNITLILVFFGCRHVKSLVTNCSYS